MEIGDRLRVFRKRAGMNQMELGEAANIADGTCADIACGSANMRLETLLKICEALCIVPNELLVKDDLGTRFDQKS